MGMATRIGFEHPKSVDRLIPSLEEERALLHRKLQTWRIAAGIPIEGLKF